MGWVKDKYMISVKELEKKKVRRNKPKKKKIRKKVKEMI